MAKSTAVTTAPEPRAAPNERTAAAIDRAKARVLARPKRVAIDVSSVAGSIVSVAAPHTDEVGQHYHLLDSFGTASNDFMATTFSQMIEAIRGPNSAPTQLDINTALAIVGGLEPDNEIEALLASQMAATHRLAMTLIGRAGRADIVPQLEANGNLAIKLLRTFALQSETLAKLKRGGGQTVRVEHVHVYPGGQAIVGNVAAGGGATAKIEDQPHAKPAALPSPTDALVSPLWSADPAREPVPLARHA